MTTHLDYNKTREIVYANYCDVPSEFLVQHAQLPISQIKQIQQEYSSIEIKDDPLIEMLKQKFTSKTKRALYLYLAFRTEDEKIEDTKLIKKTDIHIYNLINESIFQPKNHIAIKNSDLENIITKRDKEVIPILSPSEKLLFATFNSQIPLSPYKRSELFANPIIYSNLKDALLENNDVNLDKLYHEITKCIQAQIKRNTDLYPKLLTSRQEHELSQVISKLLAQREIEILNMRFGIQNHQTPLTLEQVANHYSISQERIRQIQLNAQKKLKRNHQIISAYTSIFGSF